MSQLTLEQLQAFEAKLIRAIADPTRTVFYDEFKRENRPVAELQSALATVRTEIIRLKGETTQTTPPPRRYLARHRDSF